MHGYNLCYTCVIVHRQSNHVVKEQEPVDGLECLHHHRLKLYSMTVMGLGIFQPLYVGSPACARKIHSCRRILRSCITIAFFCALTSSAAA